jgi:ArsR family transcriptional regulator
MFKCLSVWEFAMNNVIEILKAAGEDTRLRIIALLNNGELSAGELSSVLAQSQPRVSRHLKLLAEAGIVERRTEGSWVFVRLSNNEPAKAIITKIISSLDNNSFILTRDLAKLKEIREARQERAQKYFEKIAPEWESLRKLHQPEGVVEAAMLKVANGRKFDFHLDLGSGMGIILETFANDVKRGEGIDTSHGMLNLSRLRFDESENKHLGARLGDVYCLPYNNESADLITIHQVLHYLDNPSGAMAEAARVLKPGGLLLIADFAPHNFEELRNKYGHIRLGFADWEFEEWCKNSDLTIVSIQSFKNDKNASGLEVKMYAITK